jgi:2-dehydro-3-deoxyphosphogluconate aldolase/(4S)-4-hydroxy-2-oxoglutarate aldolase
VAEPDGPVVAHLLAGRLIPVVVLTDASAAVPVGRALVEAGLPVAEVTFRTAAAADAIRALTAETELLVGAGTVVRVEQVDVAVAAGARFVVTPGLSRGVVERCRERGVPVIPGVATATEVMAALDLGLDLLKLFPAEAVGGVATLRALAGPFPTVRFVPTGGVTTANARDYLTAPTVAAVGGSWMVAPDLIAHRDFAEITRLTAEAVALVAEAR